ncbi:MAG: type IIA DNA topoisomerase subunit B [Verrucomicrobia bacterium]|nr:type IIA DNA topoisomerase subunit B [Verrucomicrobiota bacterium]
MSVTYTDEDIKTLDWREHIRLRPGMYIGKLGDGSAPDDGIYVLLKEVIDNAIDEFVMGHGKLIEIALEGRRLRVRDYGRGIPLGKVKDCAAKINTGAKYDSQAFKKSVGLNGVGIKAVNALSASFHIQSHREGKTMSVDFTRGEVARELKAPQASKEESGTELIYEPDADVFGEYQYDPAIVERMLRNYSYLNQGLTLSLNGKKFRSKNGLLDLLNEHLGSDAPLYPVIHLTGEDIEIALTHNDNNGEDYFSFVNGQNTTQGGTHLAAFRESIVKVVRDYSKKAFDAADVRQGIVAAVSLRVVEPVFESQTKTKLGSALMEPGGQSVRTYMANFLGSALDNYLHQHQAVAEAMVEKIAQSERERKEIKGIQKAAREGARAAKVHNKKLRDCKVHYNTRNARHEESTLFITEGDSASGSMTTARNPEFQAVFSLKGKPLNTYGKTRKVVYENEEFNLLQHALDIENGIENLRYNRVILATDADVDGMHIRLLLITFFVQFFPDLIRDGHVFILQTPLFRVRNKKETRYCYSELEKQQAMHDLRPNPDIVRFKGLGEISPHEMKDFINENIRLDPVELPPHTKTINELLEFYMGKNTEDRQKFIIQNLRVETDFVAPEEEETPVESPAAALA